VKGGAVAGPSIFIATNRLRAGKLDAEMKRVPGLVDFVQTAEPRVIAFNEYVSEDGAEVAVVQVHPNADSMAFHMQLIAERAAGAYADTVEATTSIQVFGTQSDAVLEMLRRQAGSGVPLTVKAHHLGGFTR
jgi:biotin carboxylase